MYYLIETSKKYPHQNKKTLIGKSLRDYPNAYSEWSHKDNLLNKACISCSYKTKTYGGKIAIINCLNGDTVTLELKHVPNPKEKKPTISIHVKDKVKNTTKTYKYTKDDPIAFLDQLHQNDQNKGFYRKGWNDRKISTDYEQLTFKVLQDGLFEHENDKVIKTIKIDYYPIQ